VDKLLIIILTILILLTGCWDNIELDERAFITGIGIDSYNGKEEEKNQEVKDISKLKRYYMTLTYPNVGMIARKEEGDPSYVYTTICASPADGRQQINMRSNKNVSLAHAEVVILGEELAKDEVKMRETLDIIHRSVHFNRKIKLLVSKGPARDILSMDSNKNMDMGLYIEETLEKENRSPRLPVKQTFDVTIKDIRENDAVVLPRIQKGEREIILGGAAIICGYKLAGWLDEWETMYFNILKDRVEDVVLTFRVEDEHITFEQFINETKKKVYEEKDGKLVVSFDVRFEGNINQHYLGTMYIPFDAEYLDKTERKVAEVIERDLLKLFEKIQKEYKSDVFALKEYLRRYEPDIYERVKDNWDEVYPQIKPIFNVVVHIRRIGIAG